MGIRIDRPLLLPLNLKQGYEALLVPGRVPGQDAAGQPPRRHAALLPLPQAAVSGRGERTRQGEVAHCAGGRHADPTQSGMDQG